LPPATDQLRAQIEFHTSKLSQLDGVRSGSARNDRLVVGLDAGTPENKLFRYWTWHSTETPLGKRFASATLPVVQV
jgi:hypothetical protein